MASPQSRLRIVGKKGYLMATWSEVQEQARRELGEPVAGVWSDSSLLWWANEAITDISRQALPDEDEQYQTATIGQATYDLPDHTTKVIAVFFDGMPLTRTNSDEWKSLTAWDSEGVPRYFIADDESLRLIPAPSEDKEIRFFRFHYPAELEATDDMPWNSRYDNAVRYYILRRAMEQVNDFTAANEYAARYADELGKTVSQEIRERGTNKAPKEVW